MLHDMKQYEVVIIGGNVAGLSAANALLDQHIAPLILEKEVYPRSSMSGELYSYDSLVPLQKWGISLPQKITTCRMISKHHSYEVKLGERVYGLSRSHIEQQLSKRVKQRGGIISENSHVTSCNTNLHGFEIRLSTGHILFARSLILATKNHSFFSTSFPHNQKESHPYLCIKMHYDNVEYDDQVEMHFFEQAYVGISSLEDKRKTLVCWAQQKDVHEKGGINAFLQSLETPQQASLFSALKNIEPYAQKIVGYNNRANVPFKPLLSTPHAYHACNHRVAPISLCGDAIKNAVVSGAMAARYCVHKRWKSFAHDVAQYDRGHTSSSWFKKCLEDPLFSKIKGGLHPDSLFINHIC